MSDEIRTKLPKAAPLLADAQGVSAVAPVDAPTLVPPELPQPVKRVRRVRTEPASNLVPSGTSSSESAFLPDRNVVSAPPPRGERNIEILSLPRRKRRRSYSGIASFIFFVILPLIAATLYFGFYASNQYVAEFRFAVRDAKAAMTSSPNAATPGLTSVLGIGTSQNSADNYIVVDYILSRQAIDDLQTKIDLRKVYGRRDVDWWARFNVALPEERLLLYWQRMVSASYDQVTGIASAQVRAFTPEDAHQIAVALVEQSEELINRIANRALRDAVRFAENDVKRAEERLKTVRTELTRYRNVEQIIEPNSSVVTSNVTLAQTLKATLIQLQTELASLTARQLNGGAPAVAALQSRIKATRDQLAIVESQVSTETTGGKPLSAVVGRYEQLELDRQFAQNMVLSTMQSLEQARASLAAQHIYITPFVKPAKPESSTYPRRLLSILLTGLGCFLLWTVGLLFVRSIREHIA